MPYSKRPIHYSHRQRSKFSLFTRWHSVPFPTKLTIICGIFLISDYFLTRAQPSSANQHSRCGIATRGAARTFGEGLRRQHCSSLCSQSEGHEYVANMSDALGHYFVGFSARGQAAKYSPPSLCEQSELQCFAPGLRQMFARCPLQRCRTRLLGEQELAVP